MWDGSYLAAPQLSVSHTTIELHMDTKAFIWKDFIDWRSEIEEMIPQGICKELIESIRKCRQNFRFVDEFNLFKNLYSEFDNYSVLEDAFVTNFPLRFASIRMYHCCRPIDTESYYSKGIRVLDSNETNRRFRDLFLNNPSFPEITEFHIEQAISSMADSYMRHGYVYFAIDDRFLITYCSHYLVYGSEYIQAMAAFLERELKCGAKSELKKVGRPTVFKADMPVGKIRNAEMRELAEDIFPAWAFAIAHDRKETGKVDFSIEIEQGLQPELIVGHYHPDFARRLASGRVL